MSASHKETGMNGFRRFGTILVLWVALCLLSWKCPPILKYQIEKDLSKVVIGYYPSWKKAEFDHNKIQYRYLTHIAHAFTKPDSQGNLIVGEEYIYPELVKAAHQNKVKIMMSIGGWGNCEGFPGMASTRENRERFIGQVLRFCFENSYDGVDIDWEYVSTSVEQQNFVEFTKELSATLKAQKPPLLLTMAVPSGHFWGKWINYEEVIDSFDFIACMTYDYHGEWYQHSVHNSPLYTCHNDPCGSFTDSYSYLLRRQVPPEKLLLGIPFFGRSFDCRDLYQKFNESHYYSYSEVMDILDSGWQYIWDDCSEVPYLRNQDETEIISFDDEHSVSLKCKYIKNRQVAGIIIWEITQDYYKDSSVLLEIIGKEFKAE